ncbi:aldo/keto reductase [Butyrivibrio sp. AE3004]|uniref:aldo/keto reductase n=1 Tax=Butyrivibrio sp. AE3004 TaxID=1506994 RepID=UPI000493D9EB|nr:aldo/keto reductase [Butyrivibrio sp. AE3004]
MADWFGKDVFKLGFGLMRLPKNADGSIDIPQVCQMADEFIEAGGTYFDTAYVYDDGKSEEAFKLAVSDRHNREEYTICTKLNAWAQCHDEASAKQQFYTSLERTGAGYFDYYLLHAIQRNNAHLYDDYHIWEFVTEQKEKGLIKNWGFSFHADPEFLDELLTAHPEVDFIQLQINYADMENESVRSRACYEVARKHGKSITVMEPVKGGALANPIPQVTELFKKVNPELSPASWAIRYVAGMEGIITVLSGMSNIEQMRDNLSYMRDFKPLSDVEQDTIKEAINTMNAVDNIKCTSCHYCVEGCPQQIQIPKIFEARNQQLIFNNTDGAKWKYKMATKDKGLASSCIQCGQCEGACPQHIPIISLLQDCAANLE